MQLKREVGFKVVTKWVGQKMFLFVSLDHANEEMEMDCTYVC
jgi:hypothetical protein